MMQKVGSCVFLQDTGAVRAIKAINRHKISDPARFQVEVDIQSSLDHPILDGNTWLASVGLATFGSSFKIKYPIINTS